MHSSDGSWWLSRVAPGPAFVLDHRTARTSRRVAPPQHSGAPADAVVTGTASMRLVKCFASLQLRDSMPGVALVHGEGLEGHVSVEVVGAGQHCSS